MLINSLKDKHIGATAWVIGKGPSLMHLSHEHIGAGVVIALNESIGKVESLGLNNVVYSMQKDGCLYKEKDHDCRLILPKNAPLLLHINEAEHCARGYENKYFFDNEKDFGISNECFSSVTVIELAKYLGCTKIVYLCFDALVNNDTRSFYSDESGKCHYSHRYACYLTQRKIVDEQLEKSNMPTEWIIPEGNCDTVKDKKIRLLIATPFFKHAGDCRYINSLFQTAMVLSKIDGFEFDYLQIPHDCFIDNSRNVIASYFLDSEFTHILWIDSDISWTVEGLAQILKHDVDVVGACYPMRNNWNGYNGSVFVNADGTPVVNGDGLIKASGLPFGFIKIKHEVFEKMSIAYPEVYYEKKEGCERPNMYFNFFDCLIENGTRHSEDMSFCKRWLRIGGELWLEPRITINHDGYEGNFHEFMLKQPKPEGK